ncbi:DUF3431 domain-containing protein [Aspergillus undulatus]|uniref:DUF3431 domain-containing protein n=1 Tax=Aspergillus undulatus TaxID=1810928 RepID=UPI003CCDEE6D
MAITRRSVACLGLGFFIFCLWLLYSLSNSWVLVSQSVGLGELVPTPSPTPSGRFNKTEPPKVPYAPRPQFVAGTARPDGHEYTKTLVIPRTNYEDTSWTDFEIPGWETAVYVVDDPSAPLHPPKNKGHEVMVYLSYIIEHYDELPEIIAFMHSHQFGWHNDDLLDGNAATILTRLRPERVIREGYMNLRCGWGPGCPDWLHPGTLEEDETKQEEILLARSWGEIFPDDPIPDVLAQPCCAQFAVSRERVLSIPRARFVLYRDWVLRTELSDYISGRIWEYLWHVVFTGQNVMCPKEHVCFCDGYGICFGGEDEYNAYRNMDSERETFEDELKRWRSRASVIEAARRRGTLNEKSHLTVPEPGRDVVLEELIANKVQQKEEMFLNATIRGQDASARAWEAGACGYAPSENQLAGLVEAATAAAGQDVSEWAAAAAVAAAAGAAGNQHHLDGYAPDIQLDDDGFGEGGYGGMTGGRQYRGPGSVSGNEHGQSSGLARSGTKKRKRNEDALDPALAAASAGLGQHQGQSQHQHQTSHHANHHAGPYGGEGLEIRSTPPQSVADARAVGLHSAAALFRQTSTNKKYTRPPMSKMFTSLELSPENFLHLQAAAKAYMLDDRHPDRRDCVGQRGKGDTEMVKLRLWNCVRHFLEVEGHGPRFFGEHVVNEGMPPRTYVWPRDSQKIISLVIPLLRRMVTNERQRQYAVETRKGGAEAQRRRKTGESIQEFQSASPPKFPTEDHLQMQAHHHLTDGYGSVQHSLPAPQPHPEQNVQVTDLGLTNLFLDGYTSDWNAISKSYDTYNQNYELDNLWSLSGLQLGDWRGLVAAVDSHYQIIHGGDYHCDPDCENENVGRIVHSDYTTDLRWRIGGGGPGPARNEFASSITRDVSRVIRDNIAARQGAHDHTPVPQHPMPALNFPHAYPHPSSATNAQPTTNNNFPQFQSPSLHVRLNILQNNKRILTPLDIPATSVPDLSNARQLLARKFAGQIPGIPIPSDPDPDVAAASTWDASVTWRFRVWLPEGLVLVENDSDWTLALLAAEKVDWLDGELKVLVEV